MRILFFGLILFLSYTACVPPTANVETEVNVDISSDYMQKLLDFQDKALTDSIYPYFKSTVPAVRYHAVLSFASIQDKKGVDSLIFILDDPILEVRAAAAYALGQIGDSKAEKALINSFKTKDTLDIDNQFNQNILEALGKLGSKKSAKFIGGVKSYRQTDTFLLTGQLRALYRFGQRGIITDEGNNTAVNTVVLDQYPTNVRILAANYLARFNDVNVAPYAGSLMSAIEKENEPYIKMALVTALGRTSLPEIGDRLRVLLNKESDYRVKCNILRTLNNFGYISNIETILKYINNENQHVALCASEFLVKNGNSEDAYIYKDHITDKTFWDTRANVYKAIMKNTPMFYTKIKNQSRDEIEKIISDSKNEYEKAALINALGEDPYQYQILINHANDQNSPVLKTAIAEALTNILQHPEFSKAYGTNAYNVKKLIVEFLIGQCKTGDAGIVATTASFFKKSSNQIPKELLKDSTWISETAIKLILPRDIESYNALMECQAYINGSEYSPKPLEFNHPIDWTKLTLVNDSSIAVVKTTKGNIRIKLFTSQAPGSVINFVTLCTSDFYDGKIFHRVVPNFVIQVGCPRGDGYGALDYTIRTEVPPLYYDSEGYVGMASAGNNTEGTQFFITHSPTPHLDGKYTIFGKVIEGMDVVHQLQVGDKIIDTIITKS